MGRVAKKKRGGVKRRTDTHCPNGHRWDGDSKYVDPNGRVICRACRRITQREWRKKPKNNKKRLKYARKKYKENPSIWFQIPWQWKDILERADPRCSATAYIKRVVKELVEMEREKQARRMGIVKENERRMA